MSYPFSDKESSQEVMKKILELSKESLDSCYENISSRDIEEVAKWIRDANAVYLFATGDTMISAIGFGNKLMKLGKNAVVSGMYGEETAHCYHVSQKDVALFVSYSGNAVINKKYLKMMKRAGCKLVLISSNENLDDFDKKLLIPKKEADVEKMATYYSQTCIHYILNSLYAMYFNLDFEKNYRIKTNIDYHI